MKYNDYLFLKITSFYLSQTSPDIIEAKNYSNDWYGIIIALDLT